MKNLKNPILFLLIPSICLMTSCSTTTDEPNNNPGIFSSNTVETTTSGATIVWTESIDFDDDPVTYAVILEGNEIASGINPLTYTFTGLEPDTIYEGYVESRDGRGGTNKANFFFTTDPEVKSISLNWRNFVEGNTHLAVAYFEVKAEPEPSSYTLVVKEYSINTIPATIGRTYTWKTGDNLPTGNNVASGGSGLTEFTTGVYHANTNVSSAHVSNAAGISQINSYYGALTGTAELTIKKLK